MIYELKCFVLECDGCHKSVRQFAVSENALDLPEGWRSVSYIAGEPALYCGDCCDTKGRIRDMEHIALVSEPGKWRPTAGDQARHG